MTLSPDPTRWLFDSALAAAVVLLLGAAALAFVRQPARRQRIGEWTLLACLVVAVVAALPAWPRLSLGLLPAQSTLAATPTPAADLHGVEAFSLTQLAGTHTAPTPPAHATQNQKSKIKNLLGNPSLLLLLSYALLVLANTIRLAAAHWHLHRIIRRATPPDAALAALWQDLTAAFPAPPPLLVSDRVRQPLACGFLRPVVLLPAHLYAHARAHGLHDELRIVLLHELVHVRRRDARTWLLASLVQLLFFYQPLYWFLRRQLRLAQEYIADAFAAHQAPSAPAYAENLLRLLQQVDAPVPAMAMAAWDRPSEFYVRMKRLLAHTPTDDCCSRPWTALAGVALLAAALVAGTLTLRAEPRSTGVPPVTGMGILPMQSRGVGVPPVRAMGILPMVSPESRGVQYLLHSQSPTGGWLETVGPAPTALALKAILQSGADPRDPAVRRALAALDRYRHEDGGYYQDAEPAYNTAIVLATLALVPGHDQQIADARAFLDRQTRAQRTTTGAWYQAPARRATYAEDAERSPDAILPAYGALSYASLKSMAYAALTHDDARVRRAATWIGENWTLQTNPGPGTAEGLYYYYHLLAKTLHATGQPTVTDRRGTAHDWRLELVAALTAAQRPDGSWINPTSSRWLEDQPALVTAYSVLALQEARAAK